MVIHEAPTAPPIDKTEIKAAISLEDYLEDYAGQHYEWVEGKTIDMTPAELQHNDLIYYLYTLLQVYFELRPIGRVIGQPFIVKLPAFPNRRREPDLLVVLKSNPHEIKETYMDGPPDICIEVVSRGSVKRDHGEKFEEYEAGGVPEYWIFDPLRSEARFYRLNEAGIYIRQEPDQEQNYHTPTLPDLRLHVPTLWLDQLPGPTTIVKSLQQYLA